MDKFFLLKKYDLNGFALPNSCGEESDRVDKLYKLLDKDYTLLNNTVFEWDYTVGNKIPDITFLVSCLPVCNQKVLDILQEYTTGIVRVIPFTIGEYPYYLLTDIPIEKKKINIRKSSVKYFSNGDIMDIKKYVFIPFTPSDCIFKIEEMPTDSFITESLYYAFKKEKIKGLNIEECAINKLNFIDKLF